MLPDNSRIETGHVLLKFAFKDHNGKLQVECQRSADLFLEMLLIAAIGLPFILGGIGMLGQSLYGHSYRSLYGAAATFLFIVAVALLARGLQLLRDGFRRLTFSAEDGQITVNGCVLISFLGKEENLQFIDVAGFRINRFASRRMYILAPETVFEIVMILNTGDAIMVFPYFASMEDAEEALNKLVKLHENLFVIVSVCVKINKLANEDGDGQ